jgi:hypothetical protein
MKPLHLIRGTLVSAAITVVPSCASPPEGWQPDLVPVAIQPVEAPPMVRGEPCPPVESAIKAEAGRVTPISEALRDDALTAALIGSEAAKNASLARLARAYEKCRQRAYR